MAQNNALKTDTYQATMMAAFLMANKSEEIATHDLFYRKLPESRNYLLACGLEEALDYLKNLHFTEKQIAYIRSQPLFERQPESFFEMLRNFRFKSDVWALKEGTAFFPNEPMMILRGPTNQVEFVETFLLGILERNTTWASKAARLVESLHGMADALDFATRRIHPDIAPECARAAYIAGFAATSNMDAGMKYGIPISGTMAHAFVQSFGPGGEIDAFRAFAKTFPKHSVFLVDTYDTEMGIMNAITVAKEMEARGEKLVGIRIDSGDLAHFSRLAHDMLREAGLDYVKIVLTNDLDETRIMELRAKGARFDVAAFGTMLGVVPDAPNTGQVYKLSEHEKFGGIMKMSEGKGNLPGLKQVHRFYGRDNRCYMDEITLVSDEYKSGVPLLEKVMENGKIIVKMPTLEQVREHARAEIASLPLTVRNLSEHNSYTVGTSPTLAAMESHLIRETRERVEADKMNFLAQNKAAKKITG